MNLELNINAEGRRSTSEWIFVVDVFDSYQLDDMQEYGEASLEAGQTCEDIFSKENFPESSKKKEMPACCSHSKMDGTVPGGATKKELLANLDKVPTFVQRLQFTVKDHTVGKAATFTKVDNVIQETKNLMNVISKVVTTCFECATKYKLEFRGAGTGTGRGSGGDGGSSSGGGASGDNKGVGATGTDQSL
ncbi:hypothetical protein JTB14_031643 [Gonioctena quinquepunctata]|nr:hypothetical protein JTB14_031643 [Gonioctena quinquepunctata]